jgi:hypothetical protein
MKKGILQHIQMNQKNHEEKLKLKESEKSGRKVKFLEVFYLLKLNQEDKNHLKISITSNDNEAVIVSQQRKKKT